MRAEDNNEKQRAFHAALKYLAQRPRTVAQVRARLGPRFAETTVAAVTDRLRHEGLLNDEAFASLWQESREHHRPRSAALIRKELLERGISREVADLTVASVDDEAAGYRAGLHHARRLDGADYGTFQLRMAQYLQRRGFAPGVIRRTLARLWEEQRQDDGERRQLDAWGNNSTT